MNNFQIKKFLAPTDVLPISIIIGGVLLAILIDATSLRLIGIGITIIGLISLFMIISQRMSEYVDTRYKSKNPPPNFNITTKKDTSAKRQTFEDFVDSMKEEDKKEIKTTETSNQPKEEGFRIVKKGNQEIKEESNNENEVIENKENNNEVKNAAKNANLKEDKIVVKVEQSKLVFGDEEDIPDMPESFTPIKKSASSASISENKSDKEKSNNKNQISVTEKKSDNSQEEEKTKQKETRKIEGLSAEFLKQDPVDNLTDPKQEFEYCINRILNAIKSAGSIGTTALFMVNHNANEYKLESFSTNFLIDKITNKKKFAFGNDIISQIIKNSKPEILSEINPNSELELISYYVDKIGISSFIGVPIYYREEIIGVLTADSEFTDGFDAATVNYFSHFTRLIAILIHNYVEKYDLFQSQKTLEALNRFRITNYNLSESNLSLDLFTTVLDIVEVNFASIVLWDENIGKWNIKHISPENDISDANEVDNNSLVLFSIENNKPIYKKQLENNEFLFNKNENLTEFKKLVILPIQCTGVIYGALIVTTNNIEDLNDSDIDILEILCDYAASSFEKYQLMSVLNENSYVDNETGLLNYNAFQTRLDEEYTRALEYKRDLSFCIINIDKYSSYQDEQFEEKMETMYFNSIKIINKLKRKFDVVTKNDNNFICVLMPETKIENAKFWAEKLRNEIATNLLEIKGKKFNQTVSIGISSVNNADSLNEFIDNANLALNHSMEKTNTVTLFN